MSVSKSDRKKMAADNYTKFSSQIKTNSGAPPITDSFKRQGDGGKGDANRINSTKRYSKNYDVINWASDRKKVKKVASIRLENVTKNFSTKISKKNSKKEG